MLRPPDQQGFLATLLKDDWRCVSVIAFRRRLVIARDLPTHLTGRLVKRGHPGLAIVHSDHDDGLVAEYWRCAVVPVQSVRAKPLNQVGLPVVLATKLDPTQLSVFKEKKARFPVRRGRCIAARAIAMFARLLRSQCGLP